MTARPAPTVSVILPAALVALFQGCEPELTVDAASVGAAIEALDASWPGLRDRLCSSSRSLRPHIRVFVGGQLAGLDTILRAGDELFIATAISGG